MTNINANLKRQLRGQAHELKPIVTIGNNGLTENVLQEIDRGLYDHELIKIKINGADKKERKEIAQKICEHAQAALIQSIGHIIAIYRERIEQI